MVRLAANDIKAKREALNWTQRALADMVGVSPASVSKWELGPWGRSN